MPIAISGMASRWLLVIKFLPDYSSIQVEINVDYGMTNIIAQGYRCLLRKWQRAE